MRRKKIARILWKEIVASKLLNSNLKTKNSGLKFKFILFDLNIKRITASFVASNEIMGEMVIRSPMKSDKHFEVVNFNLIPSSEFFIFLFFWKFLDEFGEELKWNYIDSSPKVSKWNSPQKNIEKTVGQNDDLKSRRNRCRNSWPAFSKRKSQLNANMRSRDSNFRWNLSLSLNLSNLINQSIRIKTECLK